MNDRVVCSNCKRLVGVPKDLAGKEFRCLLCGATNRLEQSAGPEEAILDVIAVDSPLSDHLPNSGRRVSRAIQKGIAAEDLHELPAEVRAELLVHHWSNKGRRAPTAWYLYLLAILPIGLPFLLAALSIGDKAYAIAYGCGGAFVLTLICIGVALIRPVPNWGKAGIILGAVSVGYLFAIFPQISYTPVGSRAAQGEWEEFSPPDRQCTVLMPGRPVSQNQTELTAAGPIEIKLFVVALGPKAFLLGYNDLPRQLIGRVSNEVVLTGARDGSVSSVKGKLLKDKSILVAGGYPGREFQVQVPGTGQSVSRTFLVGRRLYQQVVVGPNVQPEDEDVQKYFGSFRLEAPLGGNEARPQPPATAPVRVPPPRP